MKYKISKDEAFIDSNSDNCKTIEYSFDDKDIDLGIAIITGRYPDEGYCVNLVSKELVFVLEGNGNLCFKDKTISFKAGDAILIGCGEKYYWETEYCKVSMTCTPAWTKEQHRIIE